MSWFDLVPPRVAAAQIRWERRQTVIRMRRLGFTFAEIGARMGFTGSAAGMMFNTWKDKEDPSPAKAYFADTRYIKRLAKHIKRLAKHIKRSQKAERKPATPPRMRRIKKNLRKKKTAPKPKARTARLLKTKKIMRKRNSLSPSAPRPLIKPQKPGPPTKAAHHPDPRRREH